MSEAKPIATGREFDPQRLRRHAGLSLFFADIRRNGIRQLAGPAILADRDKGELGLSDFDPLALALAQHPDLDVERDRGAPRAHHLCVAAEGVADMPLGSVEFRRLS